MRRRQLNAVMEAVRGVTGHGGKPDVAVVQIGAGPSANRLRLTSMPRNSPTASITLELTPRMDRSLCTRSRLCASTYTSFSWGNSLTSTPLESYARASPSAPSRIGSVALWASPPNNRPADRSGRISSKTSSVGSLDPSPKCAPPSRTPPRSSSKNPRRVVLSEVFPARTS